MARAPQDPVADHTGRDDRDAWKAEYLEADKQPGIVLGRWVRGRTLILGLTLLLFAVFLLNFFSALHNNTVHADRAKADRIAHDASRTVQRWTTTAEGMTVEMRPKVEADTEARDAIRRYLRFQRTQYLRADYADSRYGKGDVTGRADLEFATTRMQLNVRYEQTADGGSLRWILSGDAKSDKDIGCVVRDSLREWAGAVGTAPVEDKAAAISGC